MRSDLAKGSISGAIQAVITTLLVLCAVPLFVRLRGDEAFGLYSLIALVGSVNSFANLGLNVALVRFLSEQGKSIESDTDILVTMVILTVAIVPLTVAGFLFEDAALRTILNVPEHLWGDALWLYRGGLVSNVFVLLGGTFTAVLDAQGRVHVTNMLQIVYTVLYWGAIMIVLVADLPLSVIGGTTVAVTLIWFVGVGAGMLRVWGFPSTGGMIGLGMQRARRQLGYGAHLFTAGAISFFFEPLTKLLLAHFLGLREVGIFDIGMRARNQVSSLVGKVMYPLYPLFARTTDPVPLRMLVSDIEQKSAFIVAPLPGLAMIATPLAVSLLLGPGRTEITMTIVWMVSVYLLMSCTVTPMYIFLMARGHAARTVLVQTMNVIGNGIAIVLTFPWLGYGAVIAGAVASSAASCSLLLIYQKRFVGAPVFDGWSHRWAFSIVLAWGIGIGALCSWIGPTIPGAIAGGLVIVAGSVFVYRFFGAFATRDIERYLGKTTSISRLATWLLCPIPGSAVEPEGR